MDNGHIKTHNTEGNKMTTVYQTRDFFTGRLLSKPKYLGSFFSEKSAEDKLGWFFFHKVCTAQKF